MDLRPSTLARDDGYVARYLMPSFASARLADIDHNSIRTWVATLVNQGLAPATVVKAGQIMGKIMSSAVAAGRIASSPCSGVRLPRIEREEMRYLGPRDVAILAGAMDARYRAIVVLGAYGGLRIGEMLGLRRRRFDPVQGRVDVAEILVEVEGDLHVGPPKTRAGRRIVPLPRVVVDAMTTHLESFPGGPDDLVFRAPEGGPVRLASWRRRYWAPAVETAGLAPLRPHDLRHTAVALWKIGDVAPDASFDMVRDRWPTGPLCPLRKSVLTAAG